MQIFWNDGQRETTIGLDIMGLRQLDQHLEQDLVASITTISRRARYLSLLSWMFAEFYRWQLDTSDGAFEFNATTFSECLRRLEFTVVAATNLGSSSGESGQSYGVIGSDIYDEDWKLFREAEDTAFDATRIRGGGSLDTYIALCHGFGLLLRITVDNEPLESVTPRGMALYEAKAKALVQDGLKHFILQGGKLEKAWIRAEGNQFSLDSISSNPEECKLLRQAFREPYLSNPDVLERYERFNATVLCFLELLNIHPGVTSQGLLELNYRLFVETPAALKQNSSTAWAEYELRRRCHFALELLLSSFNDTLSELVVASPDDVLRAWQSQWEQPTLLDSFLPRGANPFSFSIEGIMKLIPTDAFLARGPSPGQANALSPASRAIYALILLLACRTQTHVFFKSGTLPNRGHYLESTFELLSDEQAEVFQSLRLILIYSVMEPHLNTSLRKLGNGQKCSLRFFPEGGTLRPTGLGVGAGFSGDRLGNVIGFLADVGYLERNGVAYQLTEDGRNLIAELRGE